MKRENIDDFNDNNTHTHTRTLAHSHAKDDDDDDSFLAFDMQSRSFRLFRFIYSFFSALLRPMAAHSSFTLCVCVCVLLCVESL